MEKKKGRFQVTLIRKNSTPKQQKEGLLVDLLSTEQVPTLLDLDTDKTQESFPSNRTQ